MLAMDLAEAMTSDAGLASRRLLVCDSRFAGNVVLDALSLESDRGRLVDRDSRSL